MALLGSYSLADTLKTRVLLLHFLPPELVEPILDEAQYWTGSYTSKWGEERVVVPFSTDRDDPTTASTTTDLTVVDSSIGNTESNDLVALRDYAEKLYLTLPPIPPTFWHGMQLTFRPRKIIFRVRGCDQGRSGSAEFKGLVAITDAFERLGTYQGCWSWFEAAIEQHTPNPSSSFTSGDSRNETSSSPSDLRNETPTSSESPDNQGSREGGSGGLLSLDHPGQEQTSGRWHLQTNVHGSRHRKLHEIIWTRRNESDVDQGEKKEEEEVEGVDPKKAVDNRTGSGLGVGFLAALGPDSAISIYACAQYPGWENNAFVAEIAAFYHVQI